MHRPNTFRFLLALAATLPQASAAQADLALGVQAGFPFLLDRQGYYNQPAAAGVFELGFRLGDRRIFPSLSLAAGVVQLSLHIPGLDGMHTEARRFQGLLRLNYVVHGGDRELLLSGGLGLCWLHAYTGVVNSGADGAVAGLAASDGKANLYPVLNAGVEQRWRISGRRPLYFGLEVGASYLYLFDKAEYRAIFSAIELPASAHGHLLLPTVQGRLRYVFGRE